MSPEPLQPQAKRYANPSALDTQDAVGAKTMTPPPMQLTAGAADAPKIEGPNKQGGESVKAEEGSAKEAVTQEGHALAAAPKEDTPEEKAKKGETPIRKALFEQFAAFKGAKLGDEQFDQVVSQEEWDKMKAKEAVQGETNQKQYEKDVETLPQRLVDYEAAAAKYKADSEQYKVDWKNFLKELGSWNAKSGAPRPVQPVKPKEPKKPLKPELAKVPIFTTCIATQAKVMSNALNAIGMNLKTIDGKITHSAFATDGKERGQKLGAWHEAKPNMTERPNPGDIMVLSMRGSSVDNAAAALAYGQGGMSNNAAAVKKLEKQLESLKAQITALEGTKKAVAEEKLTDMAAQLEAAQAKNIAYVQSLQEKLDAVRGNAQAQPDKLWFSHVGFVKSITKHTEKDGQVRDVPRENWETFDGGQKVENIEGANDAHRVYDPVTNEISGESQQGGAARFLKGWVNVDALVGAEKKKKK